MRGCVLAVLSGLLLVAALARAQDQDQYEIGAGDVLTLVVLGQADLSSDFTVDRDGMLALPVLGKVKAAEMAAPELERKLTTLLADGYVKNPQVSVAVKEYRSRQVFVTGEVSKPGTYPLRGDRTLRALLADVGSLGPNAGHQVVVMRPAQAAGTEPAPVVAGEILSDQDAAPPLAAVAGQAAAADGFRFSINAILSGDASANMVLQNGDTVYIPPARLVYISGQVSRPGQYRYQETMTVLQALTLAGGVTPRGSQGRAKIVRVVNGERTEFKAKPDEAIEPEDTIVVPERLF